MITGLTKTGDMAALSGVSCGRWAAASVFGCREGELIRMPAQDITEDIL